jgi:hypothetical protein
VGDKVRFLVGDIFLPTPERISIVTLGEMEVEGTIHNFSDSGSQSRVFAVVDVVRREAVVVPVDKLQVIASPEFGSDP